MNLFLDDVWDETICRLAAGVRFVDTMRGGRPITDVHVVLEDVPKPHRIPRPGPHGVEPGIGLPEMTTRRSGRFAILHPVARKSPMTVRVFHPDRRYVPRRLQLPFTPLKTVEDDDQAARVPPYPTVTLRGRVVALFPGAAYEVSGTTAVRGRVEQADGAPVPWARVWATAPNNLRVEGVGHADDRGEFVLLLRSTNALLAAAPTLERDLVLHAALAPVVASSPADPALDPLSTLPIETLPDPGQPDDVSAGEDPPATYVATATTVDVTCRLGRVTASPPFTV